MREAREASPRLVKMLPLDVTKDEDIQGFADGLKELNRPIDVLVHSLAFANRDENTKRRHTSSERPTSAWR